MKDPFDYLLPDQSLKSMPPKDQHLFCIRDGKKIRLVYDDCVFDQNEDTTIQQFKRYALKHHVDASNVPDKTILRYLYSYNFDNKETLDKLKIFFSWYSDPRIQRQDSVTLQLINQGAIYTYGRDKSLRPIIYLNLGKMDIEKYNLDDYLAAINQVINLVVEKLFVKGKLENYMFIIDMENKGIGSLPISTVREIVLKLSYIYSMRMGKLLIINTNFFIKAMYSAVCPFLAQITKEKVKIISHSQVKKGKISQYVNSDQLEKKYGGNLDDLDLKWPPQIPGRHFHPIQQNEEQNEQEYQMQEIYGENPQTTKACCTVKECVIY